MRSLLPFAILAGAGLASTSWRLHGRSAPASGSRARSPARRPRCCGGPCSVVIAPDFNGDFNIEAAVDGRASASSSTSGPRPSPSTATLPPASALHPVQRDGLNTANGVVRRAPVRLNLVEVGDIMIRDVAAVIVPAEALQTNLLGLTFLSTISITATDGCSSKNDPRVNVVKRRLQALMVGAKTAPPKP